MSALNVLLVTCRSFLSHHTSAEVDFSALQKVSKTAKISCTNMKNPDFFSQQATTSDIEISIDTETAPLCSALKRCR